MAAILWSVVDLLRGDLKPSQYGRIILPFTLPLSLECVSEPARPNVLKEAKVNQDKSEAARKQLLLNAAGQSFFNITLLTLTSLSDTQTSGVGVGKGGY